MAIEDVIESWEARTARLNASLAGVSGGAERIYSVKFDGTDDPEKEPLMALEASNIPAMWQQHPYSQWWYVVDKTVEAKKPQLYDVHVHYEYIENPLEQRADREWLFHISVEPIDKYIDSNGDEKALTNSSDETFDPPITAEFPDLVLRYERNEQYFNPLMAYEYIKSVNGDNFLGFPPGKVKCNIMQGKEMRSGDLWYFRVSYEFQFRFDGWKRRILDEGFRIKTGETEGGSSVYETVCDKDGNPLSQPVLLNGVGKRLAEGAEPYWHEFDVNKIRAFLNLKIVL